MNNEEYSVDDNFAGEDMTQEDWNKCSNDWAYSLGIESSKSMSQEEIDSLMESMSGNDSYEEDSKSLEKEGIRNILDLGRGLI